MASKPTLQKQKTQMSEVDMAQYALNMLVWVEMPQANPEDDAFMRGRISALDPKRGSVEVTLEDGKKDTFDGSRLLERVDFGTTMKEGFEDMVNMEVLNDAELMENVRKRFARDLIFTYVGPTLLVVNPFKKIEVMQQEDTRLQYIRHIIPAKDPLSYKEKPPNVYAVACEAYRSLFENEKNQSIVISGESGAGKTENAKFCMSLLTSIGQFEMFKHESDMLGKQSMRTHVVMGNASDILKATVQLAHQEDVSIEEKILNCNPILEAFGNSKTKRNNNSSRFGKYVRMVVDKRLRKIKGAEIINYLLEKSRIIQQGVQERNFHIFYHMIEGSSTEELTALRLVKDGKRYEYDWFEYLRKAQNYVSPGINDVELFHEINASFKALGMKNYQSQIYACVAAVLLLGNIGFDGSTYGNETPCELLGKEVLLDISALIGLELDKLTFALTFKNRKIGAQIINSPLTQIECENARDSLAKEIYERLFNWLVIKLNHTIKPHVQSSFLCVGLLDIYGFEVFEVNTFEQLMINYTNEKLHQLYIFYVFKEEERVFISEGLAEWCSQIKFTDNTPVIEVLEKAPIGIFNLLDESCTIASNTDDHLLQNIRKQHKANALLVNPKMPTNPTFTLIHTAKDVEYNVNGFRAKNRDETSVILLDAMSVSHSELVADLFVKSDIKSDKFLGTKIRKEMSELMKELNSCDVHFIRCIKPNEVKKCNIFHQSMTLNQIRYLGVLDSLKVRKDSYPIRRSFQLFYKQFSDIGKDLPYPLLVQKQVDFKPYTERLIKEFFSKIPPEHFLIGKTKVFMRQPGLLTVMAIYKEKCEFKGKMATKIQRMYQCFKFRKQVNRYMLMLKNLKYKLHFRLAAYRMKKYAKQIVRVQRFLRGKLQLKKRIRLLQTAKLVQQYVKRSLAVQAANRQKTSVIKIQRFIRQCIKQKDQRKKFLIKQSILMALQRAWLIILGKKALKIQKVFRGWRVRRRVIGKDKMNQIKEAGRQERIRKNATLLTKWARGFLVRKRIKQMHLAARLIQGYFKMRWLSELFQAMRKHILIIQRFVRMFIRKRRCYNEKFERYIVPWERHLQIVKEQEEQNLFGVVAEVPETGRQMTQSQVSTFSSHTIPIIHSPARLANLSPTKADDAISVKPSRSLHKRHEPDFQQSLYSSRQVTPTPRQIVRYAKQQPVNWQYESQVESIDAILFKEQEAQVLNTKIYMFTLVLDLELLADVSEIYSEPWTRTYKELMQSMLQKSVAMQVIEVGQTQTIAASVSGKAYSWGLNDYGQLGHTDPGERPSQINLPHDFRVKQVSTGENHTLILGYDGSVWAFGANQAGQLGIGNISNQNNPQPINIEPVQQIKSIGNSSFAVSQSGQLYTWPLGNDNQPILVPLIGKASVVSVSCGNQFAVLLQSNGCLQTFGENLEGELGHGDTIVRTDPCLIERLANQGEKIMQVECGFKHVVARSNNKVFTWGWGEKGQLGLGSYANESSPRQLSINQRILQVAASHRSTILLTSDHKILWCGSNRSINYQSYLVELKLDIKSVHLSTYMPVRVYPSWSHTMSVISVTFAHVKNVLVHNVPLRNKVLNQLVQKWVENGINTVDPPLIPAIATHLQEKHMKKPVQTRAERVAIRGSVTDSKRVVRLRMFEDTKNKGWQSDRSYRSSLRSSLHHKLPSKTFTRQNEIDDTNLTKLREIKKRLITLKTLPQTQWSEQDVEFIRTIYKSNLSQLLDTMNF